MGMTGAGKSSVGISAFAYHHRRRSLPKQFIKLITGDEGIKIGHGVGSQTTEIGVYSYSARDGRRVALVDTPGFDDSNERTDGDILDEIASYLKSK
jgi:predicted GTPase